MSNILQFPRKPKPVPVSSYAAPDNYLVDMRADMLRRERERAHPLPVLKDYMAEIRAVAAIGDFLEADADAAGRIE